MVPKGLWMPWRISDIEGHSGPHNYAEGFLCHLDLLEYIFYSIFKESTAQFRHANLTCLACSNAAFLLPKLRRWTLVVSSHRGQQKHKMPIYRTVVKKLASHRHHPEAAHLEPWKQRMQWPQLRGTRQGENCSR